MKVTFLSRILFLLLLFAVDAKQGHAEIIYETGDLLEFIGGSAPQLAYDNFVSHVSEGIVAPGYNDYGPDWLDVQTNGFGDYRIIDDESYALIHWRRIFEHIMRREIQAADQLLSDSVATFHYDLVEFSDTGTGRTFYMLRERLDMSYVDYNQAAVFNDDVHGSFANGWGLYIFNPAATRPQVIIELPHPCDDFISPYIGTELFLQTNAGALLLAGAGREVKWTGSGNYTNNKSLSDPSRNDNSVFQVFHEVLSDSLMQLGPHSPLVLHTHSFDDNQAHEDFQAIVLSAGWDASYANKPIRDITDDHLDFVNFTEEVPIPSNTFGIHDDVMIIDYYRVHYSGTFNYHGEENIYQIPHTYTLLGPYTGVQMNYLRQFFHHSSVYEPWVQVEMMEKPQLFQDMDMPLTELYAGDYPTSYQNFITLMQYFQPFIDAVQAYLVNWESVPDETPPPEITDLHATFNGQHYISLEWDHVEDTNHRSYRIYYDVGDIDAFSPYWDVADDAQLQDMLESETIILGLDPEAEYVFQIQAIDYFDNIGPLSEVSTEELQGHAAPTIIENFDDGEVDLDSWENQDQNPGGWTIATDRTFMYSPYSLKLYGNTWKSQSIEPVSLVENSVWRVACYIHTSGEIQGIGFADSLNHLFYSFNGSEQLDIEEWVTAYQGYFPTHQWTVYPLPVADDWFARFDYYPDITEIIYINDHDEDPSSTIYFDELLDISSIIEYSPEVEIEYTWGSIYRNPEGQRSVDLEFTSVVTDADSDTYQYFWYFGDGTSSSEAHPMHTYLVEDDHAYTVLLQVVDESDHWGQATIQVNIDPGESSFPLKLNFVGDIMLARRYEDDGGIIDNEGVEAIFTPTIPILGEAADVTIANLECPLTTGGEAHPTKSVVFRGHPDNVAGLTHAGIDIVSLANNHTLDYDLYGLQQTQVTLDQSGIRHSGSGADSYEAYLPLFHNVKGVNIAFLANCDRTGQYNNAQPYLNAGYNKPGFAYMTPYYLQEQIEAVTATADLIVMEMHAGSEYSSSPGAGYDSGNFGAGIDPEDWIAPREDVRSMDLEDISDEDENYSPDLDVPHMWDREIRHFAIDAGADLVVVHHPHIIQGFEVYNGKLIAHSLGNFVFDLNYHETFPSVILNAEVDETGFYRYSVTPVYIDDYIPVEAQGALGLHILDYLAQRSRELDTYLNVNRESGRAWVHLDTLSMPVNEIQCRKLTHLDQDGLYWISDPVPVHELASIASIMNNPGPGAWHYRLGRELIWYGNMEPEGSTEWNLNSGDEWLDYTEARSGDWSITHRRGSSAGDNIVTNLENRIRIDPEKDHSLQGFIKTQNGDDVTIEIRYYTTRTTSSSITTHAVNAGVDGDTGWTFYHNETNVPSNAGYFDIRLNSDVPAFGEARSWFDQVSVVEWTDWDDLSSATDIISPNDFYYLQVRSNTMVSEVPVEYSVKLYDTPGSVSVDFSVSETLGLVPLDVTCSDGSSGQVGWWEWDFGDGNISVEQDPVHTYTEAGIYDVTLTVLDENGDPISETKTDHVRVFTEYVVGDINFDGSVSVTDIVLLVNIILGHVEPEPIQSEAGDMNGDGNLGVQDLVALVNHILYG